MTGEEEPQACFGDIASALAEMPWNTVPEEGSKARAVGSRMGTIYTRQKKHKSVTIHSEHGRQIQSCCESALSTVYCTLQLAVPG
jgi:hypothetical protein